MFTSKIKNARSSVTTAVTNAATIVALTTVMAFSSTAAFAQDALSSTAITVVDNYLVAWNSQNATAAANLLAEDARYYDSALGATVEGRAEAKTQVIDAFMNAAPDIYWNLVGSPVISGQRVSFEWVLGGTNTGAWADGTPATGKTFRIFGASAFTVEGDSIVK